MSNEFMDACVKPFVCDIVYREYKSGNHQKCSNPSNCFNISHCCLKACMDSWNVNSSNQNHISILSGREKIPTLKNDFYNTLQGIPNFLYVFSSFSELPNIKFSFSVKNSDSQTSLLNGVVATDALAPTPPRSNNRLFLLISKLI